jgi:hypothetical protein
MFSCAAPKFCDEFLCVRGAPVCDIRVFQEELMCESQHTTDDTNQDIDTFLQHVLEPSEWEQSATHMLSEPAKANPAPTAPNSSRHKETSAQCADNAHYYVKHDVIYTASPIPSNTREQLLSTSELRPTTLDIQDTYISTYFTDI